MIYKRYCNVCGNYYKGAGKYCCSRNCSRKFQKFWNKGLTKDTDERVRKYSENLSKLRKGIPSPMKGKKRPPEFGKKISKIQTGKKQSLEHIENRRKAMIGKHWKCSDIARKRMSDLKKEYYRLHPETIEKLRQVNLNKTIPDEVKEKIRQSVSGENNPNFGKRGKETSQWGKFGELAPNWKGGRSELISLIRCSSKYIEWRTQIFIRDNYTCCDCNKKSEGDIQAHHKKQLSKILAEFKISTIDQAYSCQDLWDLNNGMTLCLECHNKIPKKMKI